MGIKAKILTPAIIITLFVAAAILASNILQFSAFVNATTISRVDAATRVAMNDLDSLQAEATAVSLGIAEDPGVIDALEAGVHEEVLARTEVMRSETGADFCTVTNAEGRVIARTHSPEEYGDSVIGQANIQSALQGTPLAGIEEGTAVRLSMRAGTPVLSEQGAIIGVVSVGYRLDTNSFVDDIKEMMDCETTIVLGDERIATTVLDEQGARVVGTRADAHIVESVLAGNTYSGQADIVGRVAICQYTPLYGPGGTPLGMLFVGQYLDEAQATIWAFVQVGLVITALLLAISITLILLVIRRIVRPLHAMTEAAAALARGDTDLDIRVNTKDETRALANAFNSMIEGTKQQVDIIEHIASGDLTVSPQARSEKDMMNRALAKLNDTLRAQAASLKEENERVRLMLDATPLASRLWDKDHNLIECNEAAVELFGLGSKQEYLDKYFELSPEYQADGQLTREKAYAMVDKAFQHGGCTFAYAYQMPDGTPIPAEVTMKRVPYGDDYVVAAYSRDLREQKKMMAELEERDKMLEAALRDAEEANSAKTSFLAHMSHEIRTPLNAVIGLSELTLAETGLGQEAQANLEKIYGAGATILSIVNDILDISKIESGKFELFPTQYDTPSLINDIVTLNIVRIGEKPITFQLFVDENMPGVLCGDDLRVKQIFNNLLSNAFKYTNAGTVEWHVSFEQDGDDIWLCSSVRDTGLGMKPESVRKLFADYYQGDKDASRRVEGTGLGLSITKSLVGLMDGIITVESEYGKGSVFNVRIRQARMPGVPAMGAAVAENLMGLRYTLTKRAKSTQLARVDLSYAHVLVVDDIVTNLDVVKGMMKPYKVKIDCATSGPQAIDLIRAGKPRYDAIFMDHMMPGMDGIEATRVMREEIGTEYARNIPVIALTANAILGNEEMFLQSGFQAFLSKPIDMAKLDAVLRRWVRDKSQEKQPADERENPTPPDKEALRTVGEAGLLAGIRISGTDLTRALERFGGDEAVLIDVLCSYAGNTWPLVGSLRDYLAAGNLADYAIVVHGIKGSSYGIFARETGRMAETLEMAANAGDKEAVASSHAAFEENLLGLLDAIETALAQIDARVGKPITGKPDMALLTQLRDACKAFDMDRVDAALEKLEAFRYESGGKLVAWLREKVSEMAFEEIAALAPGEMPRRSGRAQQDGLPEDIGFAAPQAVVLLVDDSRTDLTMALGLLRPLQMKMDTAQSGEEALRMIQEKQYDLVLMDYRMPGMDGMETTQKLRQMGSEYAKTLPVLALSASTEPGIREKMLRAGMNDFVPKPIEMEELYSAMRRWLPPQLLQQPPAPQTAPPGQKQAETELPAIEGIDTREGLRYSRTKALYLNLLGDFYKLVDIKAAKMEACLAAGQLHDMAIEAHALKNTARIIGAGALADGFSRLETCADDGDEEALLREAPGVLARYRALKSALAPFGQPAQQGTRPASSAELAVLLRGIISAMDRFDLDGADAALKQLESLQVPLECAAQMEVLRAYVADVDIEKAMELAEAMIEIIEGRLEAEQ